MRAEHPSVDTLDVPTKRHIQSVHRARHFRKKIGEWTSRHHERNNLLDGDNNSFDLWELLNELVNEQHDVSGLVVCRFAFGLLICQEVLGT